MRSQSVRFAMMCALLSVFVSQAMSRDKEALRVRAMNYPPLYFQENGIWQGLDVELVTALVKGAGYDLVFLDIPWARSLEYMRIGALDIMFNLTYTEERSAYMHYLGPQRRSRRILIVHKDQAHWNITSLNGLTDFARKCGSPIGIQLGASYSPDLDLYLQDEVFAGLFDKVADPGFLPIKTAKKRNCGFIEEDYWINYQIRKNSELNDLHLTSFVVHDENVYYGLSNHLEPDVVDRLRESYKKLEASGVMESIRKKWQCGGIRTSAC